MKKNNDNDGSFEIALSYARWKKGEPIRPLFLDYMLTDICNLDCLVCSAREKPGCYEQSELSDKGAIDLIRQAIALGVKKYHITGGGEPFVRKKVLFEIIRTIQSNGCSASIVTNGTLISAADAKEIVALGTDKIMFSLNGYDMKSDARLRGSGNYNKTVFAIKAIAAEKKKQKKKSPWIIICPVLVKESLGHIADFIYLAKELGANHLHFQPVLVTSKEKRHQGLAIEKKDFDAVIKDIDRYARQASSMGIMHNFQELQGFFGSGEKKQAKDQCYLPWTGIYVTSRGIVKPCPMLTDSKERELIVNKSLEDIWSGQGDFSNIRRAIQDGKNSSKCGSCCGVNIMLNSKIGKILREISK